MQIKDINKITYSKVVNGVITINSKSYLPQSGRPKEGDMVKITFISPEGITFNGKAFLISDKNKYWFAT